MKKIKTQDIDVFPIQSYKSPLFLVIFLKKELFHLDSDNLETSFTIFEIGN